MDTVACEILGHLLDNTASYVKRCRRCNYIVIEAIEASPRQEIDLAIQMIRQQVGQTTLIKRMSST